MAHACDEETLREARCGRCATVFYVCRRCDFGRRYCSPACQAAAHRQRCREAHRRWQQSREGRFHLAAKQAERRAREIVVDQGRQEVAPSGILSVRDAPALAMAAAPTSDAGGVPDAQAATLDETDPVGDAPVRDVRRGRDPAGDPARADDDASPRRTDAARGPVAVLPAAPLRCCVCGRPGRFVRTGPLRRLRHRPDHGALRGRGRGPDPPPSRARFVP